MAKKGFKSKLRPSKSTTISQILIGLTLVATIVAAIEAVLQIDFTGLAPTQLFLVAGVLGILGIYLKDER